MQSSIEDESIWIGVLEGGLVLAVKQAPETTLYKFLNKLDDPQENIHLHENLRSYFQLEVYIYIFSIYNVFTLYILAVYFILLFVCQYFSTLLIS